MTDKPLLLDNSSEAIKQYTMLNSVGGGIPPLIKEMMKVGKKFDDTPSEMSPFSKCGKPTRSHWVNGVMYCHGCWLTKDEPPKPTGPGGHGST